MVGYSTVSSGKLKKTKNTTIFFILQQFVLTKIKISLYKTIKNVINYTIQLFTPFIVYYYYKII